jgi:hypothetical protein
MNNSKAHLQMSGDSATMFMVWDIVHFKVNNRVLIPH